MTKGNLFKKKCIALAVAQAWCMGQAQAATIRVTTGTDELINGCTFRNAVRAINLGATTGTNCTNVSSNPFGTNDTIIFSVSNITLEGGQDLGQNRGQITIQDASGNEPPTPVNVIINPGGTRVTIRRNSSSPDDFRIIEIHDSTVSFDNVEITGGITSDLGGGGGVYSSNSTVALDKSTVSGNSATVRGAGIRARLSSITLDKSTVSGNSSGGYGGGISGYDTAITLDDSTVSDNSAGGRGGGIFTFGGPNRVFGGTAILKNSTVSGNSAANTVTSNLRANNGGGIYNQGVLTLDNSTVSGNYSRSLGGGIFNNSLSSATLNNSTVMRNSVASSGGGGVYSTGTTTLINSIVAGNISPGFVSLDEIINLNAMNASYSLFGSSTFGFDPESDPADNNIVVDLNSISLNSVLLPLANNGGPTLTHALPKGSPAIGSGKNCLTFDQRGEPRGTQCDIGAYEFGEEESQFFVTPLPNGKSVIFEL